MNDISSVYILDGDGDVIFIHEKYFQGTENSIQSLWPKFLVAFQIFISELGANETKIVLGNSKIFTGYDEKVDVHFVLKCTLAARTEPMKKILNEIKVVFAKNISSKYKSLKKLDMFALNSLEKSIKKYIEPISNVEKFIGVFNT